MSSEIILTDFSFICLLPAGHLLQLNGTKLYDKRIRVEPAKKNSGHSHSGRVNIPSMIPPSYVMPIPQLNLPYIPNHYYTRGRQNRRHPQGPNDLVEVPEDKVLQLIDVGVNLPNKVYVSMVFSLI